MSDLVWTPVKIRLGQIKPWAQNPRNAVVFGRGIIRTNKLNPRDAETSGGTTNICKGDVDMGILSRKNSKVGDKYLACVDCGASKTTYKAQKAPRCHSCENKKRATLPVNGFKVCIVCSENKPVSDFAIRGNTCKKCQSAKSLIWNRENKERKNANNKIFRSHHIEELRKKDAEYYEKNREKHLEYSREYYANHKDELAQYKREWLRNNKDKKTAQSHRRRALKLSVENTLTASEWKEIKESYFNKCAYCGKPASTQDHLVPFFSGGSNTADNVIPACWTCNTKKGKKSLLQFLYYLVKNGR